MGTYKYLHHLQVTLSGNQQPIRTEITEAAMALGPEVSIYCIDHLSYVLILFDLSVK